MTSTLIIGAKDVFRLYMTKLNEITSVLERAFVDFSARNGNAIQPVRSSTHISKYNGVLLTMPAYSKSEDSLVTKVVTVYPDNSSQGLPVVQSSVLLFDSKTGSLKCVLDGNTITALRTAHASAIATKHLSTSFDTLAVLGAGTQARSHIQIFSALFGFKEIRLWNYRQESAEKLAKEMVMEGIPVQVFSNVEDTVKDVDVIVTATVSTTPVLKLEWINDGTHINAVGACDPGWQELESALMTNSTVYVDSKEAALIESGDIIISKAEINAEIGEVISGMKQAASKGITVFKSLGMAIEDAVTANVVFQSYSANQP